MSTVINAVFAIAWIILGVRIFQRKDPSIPMIAGWLAIGLCGLLIVVGTPSILPTP